MCDLSVVRLNVGCGRLQRPNYVNMDLLPPWRLSENRASRDPQIAEALPGFVQGSGVDLPFRDSSLGEVRCDQFVEHLTLRELARFLGEVRRVLSPGGTFLAGFPDVAAIARACDGSELRNVAAIWWPGLEEPTEQDVMVLQLPASAVGHKLILTVATFARFVGRWLMVRWWGNSHTNGFVLAEKPWGQAEA